MPRKLTEYANRYRKIRLERAFLAALAATLVSPALAQDWPAKRLTLVVTSPAGGSNDASARIYAERLSARLKQPVVVDNRPGSAGLVGMESMRRSPPDGYTFGLLGSHFTAPPALQPNMTFDPVKEFAPLGRIASSAYLIVVTPSVPARDLTQFIEHARANAGRLNYGTVSNTTTNFDLARFMRLAKLEMTGVPYAGAAPITVALLGEQVQMSFLSSTAMPHIRSGKLFAIAATGRARMSIAPDVPTTFEQGIPLDAGFWYGLAIPSAVPKAIVDRLAREIAAVGRMEDTRDAIGKLSLDPLDPSVAEMTEHIRQEKEIYAETARAMGPAAPPNPR